MNWKCTNPKCGKDLKIAKKSKSNHLPDAGVVVLECSHCRFEFMTRALTEDDQIPQAGVLLNSEARVNLRTLRKKVKAFNLT